MSGTEGAQGTQGGPTDGGTLLGGGGASGGNPAAADDRAWLPEEFRADPVFKDLRDPAALAKSYANAARMVGLDKGKVLRLPDAEDAPEWGEVFGRLGRPEKPDGYELAAPEGLEPEALSEAAAAFHAAGLSKKQAAAVMGVYAKRLEQAQAAQAAQSEAARAAAERDLKAEWGNAFPERLHLAKRAAMEAGGEDFLKALDESGLGNNPVVLRALAKLGAQIAEPNALKGGAGGMSGGLAPAEARAEWERLQKDPEWNRRYLGGDAEAGKRARELFAAMYPGQTATAA